MFFEISLSKKSKQESLLQRIKKNEAMLNKVEKDIVEYNDWLIQTRRTLIESRDYLIQTREQVLSIYRDAAVAGKEKP